MPMLTRDIPVVFLSFDETFADRHYDKLKAQVPHAKRVHGVKGFDAAHKAALKEAGADEFITVDADNVVLDSFWKVDLQTMPGKLSNSVLSWRSFNVCNGLSYGNGGLKLWKGDFVESMVTHEHAQQTKGSTVVDFCWDARYVQLRPVYSVTDFTSSAYHCWRAGYREGAKMPLKEGVPPPSADQLLEYSYKSCIDRLTQWASMGRGNGYGGWAMLGALEGLLNVHVTHRVSLTDIMDYGFFDAQWQYKKHFGVMDPFAEPSMREYINKAIATIHDLTGLYLPILGPVQCKNIMQWLTPLTSKNPFEEDSWQSIQWL